MPDSFYEPDGELYLSTELTRGPWDPKAQHAGPPAALIGREVERLGGGRVGGEDGPPAQVGRITYEVLRSVPIAPLRVEARIVRPGKRVEMFEATLSDEAGEPLMRAQGWRLRTEAVSFPPLEPAPEAPLGPDSGEPGALFHTGYDVGYHTAMEYRFTRGAFMEQGPATVWMRMAVPLIPGEQPSPLQRVLAVADSGNGISAVLSWDEWLFINPELTVHVQRPAEGDWIVLDAATTIAPGGAGVARSVLSDERGPVAYGAQSLLVAPRAGV